MYLKISSSRVKWLDSKALTFLGNQTSKLQGLRFGSWWLPKSGSKPVDGKMIALEEGCFIMFRRYGWMTEESYDRGDGCPKTKSLRIQKGQANGWSLFASNEVPMRHFHPFEDSETVGALAFWSPSQRGWGNPQDALKSICLERGFQHVSPLNQFIHTCHWNSSGDF